MVRKVRLAFLAGACLVASAAYSQYFIEKTPFSGINAGSANGSTWIGSFYNSQLGNLAAFWTGGPSVTLLTNTYSAAGGISWDGSLIETDIYNSGLSNYNVFWFLNGSEYQLPTPPGETPGSYSAYASGVSGDGSTLLVQDGSSNDTYTRTFNIASQTFQTLGDFGYPVTAGTCISYDGSVVAGQGVTATLGRVAFRWTAAGGLQNLGLPAGRPDAVDIIPYCMSSDGSVIYGYFESNTLRGSFGFKWTQAGGMIPLVGEIIGCSADGYVALGQGPSGLSLLTPDAGYVSLASVLQNAGVSLTGWQLFVGSWISPDGTWVCGSGSNSSINATNFIAHLPSVYPGAVNDAYQTAYGTALNEAAPGVLANDSNTSGLMPVLQTGPSNASSFALNSDGSFNYTPNVGYSGNDTFTYVDQSANYTTAPATVTIGVASHFAVIHPSTSTPAGGVGLTLTLTGNGFKPGETAMWNSTPLATTFVSSTKIKGVVPSALLVDAAAITITIGDPWGTTSNSRTFNVTSTVPTLSSVSPTTASVGVGYTITVYGTGFVGNSTVKWGGLGLVTTFVSSTELQAQIPASFCNHPKTVAVEVANTVPGGGYSNTTNITVS